MRTAARGGELVTVAEHPVLLAERGARLVGVARVHRPGRGDRGPGRSYVDEQWTGVGTALLDALESLGQRARQHPPLVDHDE